MALFGSDDRRLAEAIAAISYCNPFLPERFESEKRALGDQYVSTGVVWHIMSRPHSESPNVMRLLELATQIADRARERLARGISANPKELALYEDVVLFTLYHEFEDRILRTIEDQLPGEGRQVKPKNLKVSYYERFRARHAHYVDLPGSPLPEFETSAHCFALFFHLRRAFFQIFNGLVGSSMAMAKLRAAIWQSIFTYDMRRYRKTLYDRMGDVTTLITGPSGTGKELVALSIGQSRYIPFDESTGKFTEDFVSSFYALNLSALSSTLIESELFGHRRGAFTGALEDHVGWFENCGALGSVFLDEIGELDTAIQVKLLRVLQTRTFQRIGDTNSLTFQGKVIAATNRDLAEEMRQGRFREDFYYRLCSDMIETPPLSAQLGGDPEELARLVRYITGRLLDADEAERLATKTVESIEKHLGFSYDWPGNFRELEQCVRNVLIRGEYTPPERKAGRLSEQILREITGARLTAEDLIRRYCTIVYSQCENYEATARQLNLDRRTVKAKLDPELLERIKRDGI